MNKICPEEISQTEHERNVPTSLKGKTYGLAGCKNMYLLLVAVIFTLCLLYLGER